MMEDIQKKILDELEEEILELKRQGKLHKFEEAMDNAMGKFKNALSEKTESVINKSSDEINDGNNEKKNVQNVREIQK